MAISDGMEGVKHDEELQMTEEQLERQRMLAMRVWEMRERRRTHHPVYRRRRTVDSKAILQHMLGTLLVLGVLIWISRG